MSCWMEEVLIVAGNAWSLGSKAVRMSQERSSHRQGLMCFCMLLVLLIRGSLYLLTTHRRVARSRGRYASKDVCFGMKCGWRSL